MKIVKVTWEDAQFWESKAWAEEVIKEPPYLVVTLGFLLEESEAYIIIASGAKGAMFKYITKVPKSLVREVKYYNEDK